MIDTDLAYTPLEGIRELQPMPDWLQDTLIVPAPDRWYLCTLSEQYLEQALTNEGTVTVVNNALVVKPVGKLAGLCIQDVMGPNGEVLFKKGSWYCPVGECRQELLDNFGLGNAMFGVGKTRITMPRSSWSLMRVAKPPNLQTLGEYIQVIVDKTTNLPPNFQFKLLHQEAMPGKHDEVTTGTPPPDIERLLLETNRNYFRSHILEEIPRGARIGMNELRERIKIPFREIQNILEFDKIPLNNYLIQPNKIKSFINNNVKKDKFNYPSLKEILPKENIIKWNNLNNYDSLRSFSPKK